MDSNNGQRGDGTAAFVLRLLADVDSRSPVPLYDQIGSRLKAAIGGGILVGGDPLPSVRHLASALRINPATVVQAYRHLEAEGFAEMRQGTGTFAKTPSPERQRRQRESQAGRLVRRVLADAAKQGVSPDDLKRAWTELFEEPNG